MEKLRLRELSDCTSNRICSSADGISLAQSMSETSLAASIRDNDQQSWRKHAPSGLNDIASFVS